VITVAQLSVIVPTLNEAATLPALFDALALQRDIAVDCIVSDGGSDDTGPAIAGERGARVLHGPRGRGRQFNAGARAARTPWLLFLHADSGFTAATQLAEAVDALDAARRSYAPRPVAGHFALRFERSQPGHDRLFAFLEAKSASNRPFTINGDQGLLIHRDDFSALGGYDESLPIFEDQRIAARIFERGRWLLLPHRLLTSARRFEAEGHLPRYTLMAMMMGLEHGGLLPGFIAEVREAYAIQKQTRALQLAPFRRAALRQLRAAGVRGGVHALLHSGRLLRDASWQLALLRDLARGDGRDTAVRRHDRWLAPILRLPGSRAAAAAAVLATLVFGLPLIDRRPRIPTATRGVHR
jgi:rSAM/selenodomain-associated transferase 2